MLSTVGEVDIGHDSHVQPRETGAQRRASCGPPSDPGSEAFVFILNSDAATCAWVESTAASAGLHAVTFNSAQALISRFVPGTAACVILDAALPDGNAFELQDHLARAGASIVFLTRMRCISACVRAIKAGAVDFITVPCDAASVVRALRDAIAAALRQRSQRMYHEGLRLRYERLTKRERDVFALVSTGLLNKQVAQQLGISDITVQIHRGRVMKKMAARSFASLVRMADSLLFVDRFDASPASHAAA